MSDTLKAGSHAHKLRSLSTAPKTSPGDLPAFWHGRLHARQGDRQADAGRAFDFFLEAYGAKYDKAVACLAKDRDCLLSFYDFPAEHWKHVRSTNPIESTFATVRLRTAKTKGCLSRKTALGMIFKLLLSARKKWRRLNGSDHLAEVIQGVRFEDGIKQIQYAA